MTDIIMDDACIRCDSYNIIPTIKEELVTYKCLDCGAVWSSEDDYYPIS